MSGLPSNVPHDDSEPSSDVTGGQAASQAKPLVDVTVVTNRDDFLLELGEVLGGRAAVRPVESVEAALPHVTDRRRGQLVILDAGEVGEPLEEAAQLAAAATHAIVLIFTARDPDLAHAASSHRAVFAFLPLPFDPQRTLMVLDTALQQAAERIVEGSPATTIPAAQVGAHEAASEQATPAVTTTRGASRWSPRSIGVGVALVVAVGIAIACLHSRESTPENGTNGASASGRIAATPPTDGASLVSGATDELLERARLAMRERRYSEPAGDNALLFYRSALATDPASDEAKDGLQRVASVLAARFDQSLGAGRLEEAASAFAGLELAAPTGDPRVAALEIRLFDTQFSKALVDANLDRANALLHAAEQAVPTLPSNRLADWKAALAQRSEQIRATRQAELAARRAPPIKQPATTDVSQGHPTTQSSAAPSANSVDLARSGASTRVDSAADAGASSQSAASAGAPETPRASAEDVIALAASLKRTRTALPTYPTAALAKGVEGFVTVQYTVDASGTPIDLKVLAAQPTGVFDSAATTAVKRWRYAPATLNGSPVEVPVKTTIRFQLPK